MTDTKSILIGALMVAVVVLGYVAYERNQRTVEIVLPSVSIGRP